MRVILSLLILGACTAPDAGCLLYGEARITMPTPLGEGPLPSWVAALDDRMTGGCR